MGVYRRSTVICLFGLLALTGGCDAIDRARGGSAPADTLGGAGGLSLGMQVPGELAAGQEGVVRLTVVNRGDTVVSRIWAELIVPGWAEPMPPRAGDPEVGMTAMDDGGTRFTYRVLNVPLERNQSHMIEQRIRVPATGPLAQGAVPWTRVVRARLLNPQGQPVAEVESEVALQVPPPASAPAYGTDAATTGTRDRLGPVRLGMPEAELRQQAGAQARDTSWTQEGMAERGVLVPAGGGSALAVLDGDTVSRIEVRDPAVRTQEQVGVGSTYGQLRGAYGSACADVGEGFVVVWFPGAPGISFALDVPPPSNVAQLRASPDVLPAAARVTRWWLRRGGERCPS
jgi:hypothetical protein